MSLPRRSAAALLALLTALVVAAGLVVTSSTGQASTGDGDAGVLGVDVAGTGRASGVPDVLRFDVGVQVPAATVDGALTAANAAQARVVAVLKQRGIAARDIQTTSVRVDPRYDAKGRTITGYVVAQQVRVTARDLRTAGATLGAAVTAGGNAARLSGVRFALEEDQALRTEARDAAFAEARAKAEQYARLSGRTLGAVQSVREDVRERPFANGESYDLASARSAAVPLEAGSSEVEVDVQVRWALR